MQREEQGAHEGDSALYCRLAMAAMDINELCQSTRHDVDRIGLIMATAMLDIEAHREAHRITAEQRERLLSMLKEGIDEPEDTPRILRFPFSHHGPTHPAA